MSTREPPTQERNQQISNGTHTYDDLNPVRKVEVSKCCKGQRNYCVSMIVNHGWGVL